MYKKNMLIHFCPVLTEEVHAVGCDFVLRDMDMFVGQQFLTYPPSDEALNYPLSALSWGFLQGFLNLWNVVCKCFYLLSMS